MVRADPLAGQPVAEDAPARGQPGPDDGLDEHAGLEPPVAVRHRHADLHRAGLLVQDRIDERDPPGKPLARIRPGGELDVLPRRDPRKVRLVRVQVDPHLREVGDRVDAHARLDVHPLLCVLVDDDPRGRRVDRQVVRHLAALLDLRDLLGLEPQQPQLLPGRGDHRLGGLADDARAAGGELLGGLEGPEQLLLGAEQLGAVDVRQVIALADRHARVVHEQPVQSPAHPGGDVREPRLVVVDLPHQADLRRDELPLDRGDLDVHQRRRLVAGGELPRPAGHVTRRSHGDQGHLALGADSRPGPADLRVHGARPERARLGRSPDAGRLRRPAPARGRQRRVEQHADADPNHDRYDHRRAPRDRAGAPPHSICLLVHVSSSDSMVPPPLVEAAAGGLPVAARGTSRPVSISSSARRWALFDRARS